MLTIQRRSFLASVMAAVAGLLGIPLAAPKPVRIVYRRCLEYCETEPFVFVKETPSLTKV